jgi:hypothetical protein
MEFDNILLCRVEGYPFTYYYYFNGELLEVVAFAIKGENLSEDDIAGLIRIRISELQAEGRIPIERK